MKVLIVEDLDVNRKLLRLTLQAEGHNVIEATDGIEALEALKRETIDVVITDILMPNMDGYRLCQEIRQDARFKSLAVIVYSGTYASPTDAKLSLELGANVFLPKPSSGEVLNATINKVVAEKKDTPAPSTNFDATDEFKQYNARLVHLLEERSEKLIKRTAELAENEEKFRQLAEHIEDVFWMRDLKSNELIYINQAYERVWGRSRASLRDKPMSWLDSVHPEDKERVATNAYHSAPSYEHNMEYRIVRPDGSIRWVVDRAFPIRDASGAIYRVTGIVTDITKRKQAEALMREITNLVPHGIFAKDSAGRYIFANRALAEGCGFSEETILGKTDFDLVSDRAQAEAYRADDREVIESGRQKFIPEEPNTDLSGRTRILQTTKIPFTVAETGERAVLGAWVDITARKRAEEALRQSEARLKLQINQTPIGCIVFSTECTILSWNPAAEKIFGYTAEEAVGKNAMDLIVPNLSKESLQPLFEDLLKNNRVLHNTNENMTKDGRTIICNWTNTPLTEADGTVASVMSMVQDVTEAKRSEEALKRSERQVRLLLDSTAEAIYGIDIDGKCTFCNPASLRLLSYNTPADLLGKDMHELIHHSRADKSPYLVTDCPIYHAIQAGKGTHVTDEVFWRADGTCFPAEYWSFPIYDEGNVSGAVVTFLDITERKRFEDQIRQSQKMEAIGQLAGGVAHDFNNQLNVIMGYAGLLADRLTDPKLQRFTKSILASVQRSADLTKKLLAFSRKGQLLTVPVSLHQILGETKDMLERSIDKRIEIKLRFNAESDVIMGDPSQIQNAFLNLGVNARDAMPNGGTLTFGTETARIDPKVISKHSGEALPGDYVKVCVSDTGSGMTQEVKQHIFEPFFTTKPIGKGTGMGLASVFGTVKNHKGLIDVYSEVGHGTTFKIYLPLEKLKKATKSTLVERMKIKGKLRIMLVEDEEILRIMFSDMLSNGGHEIVEAENGRAAVKLYRENWQQIDLVLVDMIMPEMNGPDTFRAMKKINPKIKALLATGYSLNNEVQQALDEGILGFIQKPFMPDELLNLIAKVANEN